MPPPPPPQVPQTYGQQLARQPEPAASAPIAPQPNASMRVTDDPSVVYETHVEGKKLQKRAANRRSAQLSRKRKKQFMEELREENDDLRRKEQILKSIPDLILVFDSTGKLWFVSESVSRFLQFGAEELEGSSIWDRMCDASVRLLKAAFMDALAARQPDSDTASLGTGFWELRLVDRDGSQKVVTMNGVVHFAGDRPECVCSIRRSETTPEMAEKRVKQTETQSESNKSLIKVKPHQSVLSTDEASFKAKQHERLNGMRSGLISGVSTATKEREAVRISDSGNSSYESDSASGSGSGDELNVQSSS
jgi:PAS domain S-box-containing protein